MDSSHNSDISGKSTGTVPAAAARQSSPDHSYKFQRVREKIRAAIVSGELAGKLPGERALAERFGVDAKTLSKALTDLAAEGLLDRSIGRGTYIKGSAPPASGHGPWLVLCDPGEMETSLVSALRAANRDLHAADSASELRPSFLNQFAAVIDTASQTPEAFLRALVVRNMPVVAVNREPKTYSMHSVLMDAVLGASRLGRDLAQAGHRRIAVVEARGDTAISIAVRHALSRYASDGAVDACSADEVRTLLDSGATAVVCASIPLAENVVVHLRSAGVSIPAQVSVSAVGCAGGLMPCSGYYCSPQQLADAVTGLLRDGASRPATLWLAGQWHDQGTIGPTAAIPLQDAARLRLDGVLV